MTRPHRAWGSSYDVDLTLVPSTVALPVWHYPCARPWVWKCDISLGGPRRTINDLQIGIIKKVAIVQEHERLGVQSNARL